MKKIKDILKKKFTGFIKWTLVPGKGPVFRHGCIKHEMEVPGVIRRGLIKEYLKAGDILWCVTAKGEVVLDIQGRIFCLYKGGTLEYVEEAEGLYPLRALEKRELGESLYVPSCRDPSAGRE